MNIEQLRTLHLVARKTRDEIAKRALSTIISDYETQVINGKSPDLLAMVKKSISNLEFNMQHSESKDIVKERDYLASLLPKQLSEDQLRDLLETNDFPNIGAFMKFLKTNFNGQYDGKLASNLAKEIL